MSAVATSAASQEIPENLLTDSEEGSTVILMIKSTAPKAEAYEGATSGVTSHDAMPSGQWLNPSFDQEKPLG